MTLPENISMSAEISPCQRYRYVLHRWWSDEPRLVFVGVNPSTADSDEDDQTIRRCMYFAHVNGFGGITMLNLLAFRSTDPASIPADLTEALGDDNELYVDRFITAGTTVVCAWGTLGKIHGRSDRMVSRIRELGAKPVCLGRTAEGWPRHPSRLPNSAVLEDY